jgi:energy-coupling factor transport system substrate-specific component
MKKRTVRELTALAAMSAVLEASKAALSAIPNVELVSLLFMVYTLVFGARRTLAVSFIFTGLECLVYGIGIWTADYLYVWPVLILFTYLLRRHEETWVFAVLSCFFGLSFGALCALVTACVGGWSMAFSWWLSGIPYDVVHGVSNFIVAMLLFQPLKKALTAVCQRMKLD